MVGEPNSVRTQPAPRVAARRERTKSEILAAARRLAAEQGLAGFSLRQLAAELDMRAPSLYGYFPSKDAIYDALFASGYRELRATLGAAAAEADPDDPVVYLAAGGRAFLAFCAEDPARYLLMFQRTIPGWEPSPEAYAPSLEVLDDARRWLAAIGVTDAAAFDLWNAILAGLAAQQLSNEPGGDRWSRLVDEAAQMFATHHLGGPR